MLSDTRSTSLTMMNHPKPPSAPRASSSKAPSPLARSRVMQFAEKVVLQLWK